MWSLQGATKTLPDHARPWPVGDLAHLELAVQALGGTRLWTDWQNGIGWTLHLIHANR